MKAVAIFCGSSSNSNEAFNVVAEQLGFELAKRNIQILCGGNSSGLMHHLIEGAFEGDGEIVGVQLDSDGTNEVPHPKITSVIKIKSIGARKDFFLKHAEGFITLPGSFGTLDELFAILSSMRAGFHNKPCAILNTNGFYEPLISQFQNMVKQGFIKSKYLDELIIEPNIAQLLKKLNIAP